MWHSTETASWKNEMTMKNKTFVEFIIVKERNEKTKEHLACSKMFK